MRAEGRRRDEEESEREDERGIVEMSGAAEVVGEGVLSATELIRKPEKRLREVK